MARPTLGTHPKFARLAAIVGGRGAARGALELIWDAAYASGDPVIGDSISVEAVADWRGASGALTAALVSSGFLDEMQTDANGKQLQTFAVHDLEDHAPDYVLKRWQREAARRENGDTLRTVRQRAANERWASANGKQLLTSVLPPAPAPAPAPARKDCVVAPAIPGAAAMEHADQALRGADMAIGKAAAVSVDADWPIPQGADLPPREPRRPLDRFGAATSGPFQEVFDAYPRKDAKVPAGVVFQELAAKHDGGERGLADEILAALPAILKRHPYNGPNDKRPFLEKFLAQHRWLDPESAPDDAPARGPPTNGSDVRIGHARAEDFKHKGGGTDHEF